MKRFLFTLLAAMIFAALYNRPCFGQQQPAPSGEASVCQTTTTTTRVTNGRLPRDVTAKADVSGQVTRSISTTITSTSIGVLYLADGTGQSATALAVPLFTFAGTSNKLKICAIGAVSLTANTQIYAGAAVSYLLYSNSGGYSLTLYAGAKGFDVSKGFTAASGAHQPVFGFGVSIPIKSL